MSDTPNIFVILNTSVGYGGVYGFGSFKVNGKGLLIYNADIPEAIPQLIYNPKNETPGMDQSGVALLGGIIDPMPMTFNNYTFMYGWVKNIDFPEGEIVVQMNVLTSVSNTNVQLLYIPHK